MKNKLPLFTPLLVLASSAILYPEAKEKEPLPASLIKSGGFEGEAINFPRWRGKPNDRYENDGCLYCGPSGEEAHSGKQSCRIETKGKQGDCLRYWCTGIEPGQPYRYEFYYNVTKLGGGHELTSIAEVRISRRQKTSGALPRA